MKLQAMRDAFWDKIYDLMINDEDIVIISADLGAPSLDKIKDTYPERYFNTGISEQNAVLVATGMAMCGKKPIVYAISQFLILRAFEQIRIYPAGMNLNITLLGVGAGASYWESGPTHACIEQLSIMRTLPNIEVINCSSQKMATELADYYANVTGPKYIQLDRFPAQGLYSDNLDIKKGFKLINNKSNNVVITTGIMVSIMKDILNSIDLNVCLVDLFKIPVNEMEFKNFLLTVEKIIVIEENVLPGGFGSYILEFLNVHNLKIPVIRRGINTQNGYEGFYNYGGRESIRGEFGLDKISLVDCINNEFRK